MNRARIPTTENAVPPIESTSRSSRNDNQKESAMNGRAAARSKKVLPRKASSDMTGFCGMPRAGRNRNFWDQQAISLRGE
jgi:hypothetical protein